MYICTLLQEFLCILLHILAVYSPQEYDVFVRDLTTTLLFLVVFLKWHSEEIRQKPKQTKCGYSAQDTISTISTLFVSVADIFHCWFSSPVREAPVCTGICSSKSRRLLLSLPT